MATIKTEIQFTVTLTQKEFSLMTRSLAGHELSGEDSELALDLNVRLLKLREQQIRQYSNQASHALKMATAEAKEILGEK